MNKTIRFYFIFLALGTVLALVFPGLTTAAQTVTASEETPPQETDQSAQPLESPVPLLKPDSPKMAEPKHLPPPRQLKGSVQHSEVVKPHKTQLHSGTGETGQTNANLGKLNGSLDKGLFNLKSNQLNGGINQNKQSGLGIVGLKFAIYFGRTPIINQVFPETPAAAAGLKPRDSIIAVDGVPTFGLTKNEVYSMIVGKPGTEVTLSFTHNHNFQTCTLTRIDVNSIPDPRVRRDYLSM